MMKRMLNRKVSKTRLNNAIHSLSGHRDTSPYTVREWGNLSRVEKATQTMLDCMEALVSSHSATIMCVCDI